MSHLEIFDGKEGCLLLPRHIESVIVLESSGCMVTMASGNKFTFPNISFLEMKVMIEKLEAK
jgi:hypothetical protein